YQQHLPGEAGDGAVAQASAALTSGGRRLAQQVHIDAVLPGQLRAAPTADIFPILDRLPPFASSGGSAQALLTSGHSVAALGLKTQISSIHLLPATCGHFNTFASSDLCKSDSARPTLLMAKARKPSRKGAAPSKVRASGQPAVSIEPNNQRNGGRRQRTCWRRRRWFEVFT